MYARLEDPLGLRAPQQIRGLLLLLCLSLTGCSSPDPAATTVDTESVGAPAAIEQDGEQLRVIPPNGWSLASSSNQGSFRRARYVRDPDAEVIESLTLEAFPAADQVDPLTFLDGLAADAADRCNDFSREPTFAGEERGVQVAVELHRCPRRPVNGRATVSLIKVIQGQETYAVITLAKEARAQSGEDGWRTDFVEEADVARWALYLKNTTIESTGAAEAADGAPARTDDG